MSSAPSSGNAPSYSIEFRDGHLVLRIRGPLLGTSEVALMDKVSPLFDDGQIKSFELDLCGRDCMNHHLIRVVALVGKNLKMRGKTGFIVNESAQDQMALRNSGLLGDHLKFGSPVKSGTPVVSQVKSQVLIVDDEKELSDLVTAKLTKDGISCVTAENGEVAYKILTTPSPDGTAIDAVLSDIRMPGMTGIQLLENLRKQKINVPFVFLSAIADKANAIAAMRLGAVDMLDKPFDFDALVKTVKSALEVGVAVRLVESRLGGKQGAAVDQIKAGHVQTQKALAASKKIP